MFSGTIFGMISRRLWALAAVLVAGATLAQEARLLGAKPTTTRSAARPTVALTPTPTFAPLPALPPTSQGWSKLGPDYAETLALVPSQPGTMYTCGARLGANGTESPPYLGVSRDSGKTWQTLALPASCQALRASPSNAQDLAFAGDICGGGACAVGPDGWKSWLYLTTDGGHHWKVVNLPPNASDTPAAIGELFARAGTALFVSPQYFDGATPPSDAHTPPASTDGGPFAWVDQNGMRAQVSSTASVYQLVSTGTTLYVNFGRTYCTSTPCATVAETTTGGASWTALPILPGGSRPVWGITFALPDGMIIAQATDPPNPIYKLSPEAAAWTVVAPEYEEGSPVTLDAVSWDANGHPQLLWMASHSVPGGLFVHEA